MNEGSNGNAKGGRGYEGRKVSAYVSVLKPHSTVFRPNVMNVSVFLHILHTYTVYTYIHTHVNLHIHTFIFVLINLIK